MLDSTEPAPTPPPLPMGASGVARSSSADPSGARYYYRARYYDPKIGRFISEDPLRIYGPAEPMAVDYGALFSSAPAVTPSMDVPDALVNSYPQAVRMPTEESSLYVYVDNEPVRKVDPYGMHGALTKWLHRLHQLHLIECLIEKGRCNKKVQDACKCQTRWKNTCEFNGWDCCNSGFLHCISFGLLGRPCKIATPNASASKP